MKKEVYEIRQHKDNLYIITNHKQSNVLHFTDYVDAYEYAEQYGKKLLHFITGKQVRIFDDHSRIQLN